MPGTDFFDDDLIRQRESAKRIKMGPADEPVETLGEGNVGDEGPSKPVSDFNLTRMARYRHEVDQQASVASQELERLRKRQEQLEHEKHELEDLRRKHHEYDVGKREMMDHVKRSLSTLEKQEMDAQRLTELLGATRKKFKSILSEIEGLSEETWPEDKIRDELNRSLGVIEDARMEYNKSIAKIEAIKGEKSESSAGQAPVLFDEHHLGMDHERPFSHWFKVGLAFSLPIVILLLALLVILFFMARSNGQI